MHHHPNLITSLRTELYDWRLWATRGVVLAFACLAGLTVVSFTMMSEYALRLFDGLHAAAWWAPLLLTPLCTAAIVWLTRRFTPGAAGSGIPQVIAALSTDKTSTSLFVSFRLSVSKIFLTINNFQSY